MVILSITGYIGSGKDTCANYLVENYGFKKFAFASSLKDVTAAAFGWDRKILEGDTQESREFRNVVDTRWSEVLGIPNFTPRKALQFIGTDVFKTHVSNKFWIEKTMRAIEASGSERIIVTDCRFHDEFKAMADMGATTVYVERAPKPRYTKYSQVTNPLLKPFANVVMRTKFKHIHPSEWKWNDLTFDHTIDNRSDLHLTTTQLDSLMEKLNVR